MRIAELHRERWKIELFFKWIKHHHHIKAFNGTSSNAGYCQIWIAKSIYLLATIAKKKLNLAITLYTFAPTLGLTLFKKTPVKELFEDNKLYSCPMKTSLQSGFFKPDSSDTGH